MVGPFLASQSGILGEMISWQWSGLAEGSIELAAPLGSGLMWDARSFTELVELAQNHQGALATATTLVTA